ncbi:MAG: DUF2934 domain-containing protein [Gallionella sp.]|nr:DUF2934 domain-containing protein [Gallionella sp.]
MKKSEAAPEKKPVIQEDALKNSSNPEVAKAKKPRRSKKSSEVSQEMRHQLIADAAYFRAEKFGHSGDPLDHWLMAEIEIDLMLKENGQKN